MKQPRFELGQKVRMAPSYVESFPKRWKDPVEVTHRRFSFGAKTFFYNLKRYTKSGRPKHFGYEVSEKYLSHTDFGKIPLESFL